MPYKIEPMFGGFVVKKGKKTFSKKPLSLKKAKAQRIAIILSERNRI